MANLLLGGDFSRSSAEIRKTRTEPVKQDGLKIYIKEEFLRGRRKKSKFNEFVRAEF